MGHSSNTVDQPLFFGTQQSTVRSLPSGRNSNNNNNNNNNNKTMASDDKSTGKGKVERITNYQKQALFNFFTNNNFGINTILPKQGGNKELDDLLTRLEITDRSKARRQLLNWKAEKKEYKGVVIPIDNSKMKDELEIHIGMDKSEFVKSVLRNMMDKEEDAIVSMYCQQEKGKALIKDLLEDRCSSVITGLVSVLDEYSKLCISCFPQIAKMVDEASFRFHQERTRAVSEQWFAPFYRSVLNNIDSFCESVKKFNAGDWKTAFTMIELALHYKWAASSGEHDLPPIRVTPANGEPFSLVHKLSLPILAYCGGWIIAGLKTITNVNEDHKKFCLLFADAVSIAPANDEPRDLYSMIRRREQKDLNRPCIRLIEYLCYVEATFIQNFTVQMMIAYSGENLLASIQQGIKSAPHLRNKFFTLFAEGQIEAGEADKELVMDFVLNKFKNMRGKYLCKAIKTQKGENKMESAATRTFVAAQSTATLKQEVSNDDADK